VIDCVAVFVVAAIAVKVNVTELAVEWLNDPVTVPLVNGVVSVRGLPMLSVFVIVALAAGEA
jgi:hypothetical protein